MPYQSFSTHLLVFFFWLKLKLLAALHSAPSSPRSFSYHSSESLYRRQSHPLTKRRGRRWRCLRPTPPPLCPPATFSTMARSDHLPRRSRFRYVRSRRNGSSSTFNPEDADVRRGARDGKRQPRARRRG